MAAAMGIGGPGAPTFLRPLPGEPHTQRTLGPLTPLPRATRSPVPLRTSLPSLPRGGTGVLPTMPAAILASLPRLPSPRQPLPILVLAQQSLPALFPLAPKPQPAQPLAPAAFPAPPPGMAQAGLPRNLPVYASSLRAVLAAARGGGVWPPPAPAMSPQQAEAYRDAVSRVSPRSSSPSSAARRLGEPGPLPPSIELPATNEEVLAILREYTFGAGQ